jgi:hypothetical protein
MRFGRVIPPGTTHEEWTPADSDFSILAIVFDDETSEGDQAAVRKILLARIGQRMMMARIKPLLNRVAQASDEKLFDVLRSVRADIEALQDVPEPGMIASSTDEDSAFEIHSGLRRERFIAISVLQTAQEMKQFYLDVGKPVGVASGYVREYVNNRINLYNRLIERREGGGGSERQLLLQ